MAKKKTKIRYVEINVKKGNFVSKLLAGTSKAHDFSDVKLLRNLLTNEKARILSTIKTKKPSSIYSLAKTLKRDFKSVREDLKVLERFGFLEFIAEKKGKRTSHRPVLSIERLQMVIDI